MFKASWVGSTSGSQEADDPSEMAGEAGVSSVSKKRCTIPQGHEELYYRTCQELWPSVSYEQIRQYFIHSKDFDEKEIQAHKSLAAYFYVKAGKVHSITVAAPDSDTVLVKGEVSPSQRTDVVYQCWVAVHKDGTILDATCKCPSGLGRCCSHAAAVCFVLHFWSEEKQGAVGGGASVTDVPCLWVMPRLKQVETKLAEELEYSRHKATPHSQNDEKQPDVTNNGNKITIDVKGFIEKLRKVAPQAKFFTLIDTNPDHTEENQVFMERPTAAQFYITKYNPLHALSIQKLRKMGCAAESILEICEFASSIIQISSDDAADIEQDTRKQRESSLWYAHRQGMITASIFKEVCSSQGVKVSSLLKRILYPTQLRAAAIKYGIENEPLAKRNLLAILEPIHLNATIHDCGLMISQDHPFLGCTPDGIFECSCHPPVLVEIKCLYSLRTTEPSKLVEEGQRLNSFCLSRDGHLKRTHKYYYQVQAQIHLNLQRIESCYLYLHVEQGGLLLHVEKDNDFLQANIEKVETFFKTKVLPRILLDS